MIQGATLAMLREQHGVITRAAALGLGLQKHQIRGLLQRGQWERVHPGVYRDAVAGPGWHSDLLAACLARDGIASHRAAARLHRIEGFERARPEMSVDHGRHAAIDGIVVHQSTQMHLAAAASLQGVPSTGLDRTVLDVAAVVPRRRLDDVVDQVIRTKRLRWTDLYRVLGVHSRRGRNGCGVLRQLLADRFGERVPLSLWSRLVADALVAHGLPEPRLEYRISDAGGGFVAQVDLAYPASRVVIELDSLAYHHTLDGFERDRARYRQLGSLGWAVLPLTWKQYAEDMATFITDVRTALTRS